MTLGRVRSTLAMVKMTTYRTVTPLSPHLVQPPHAMVHTIVFPRVAHPVVTAKAPLPVRQVPCLHTIEADFLLLQDPVVPLLVRGTMVHPETSLPLPCVAEAV